MVNHDNGLNRLLSGEATVKLILAIRAGKRLAHNNEFQHETLISFEYRKDPAETAKSLLEVIAILMDRARKAIVQANTEFPVVHPSYSIQIEEKELPTLALQEEEEEEEEEESPF